MNKILFTLFVVFGVMSASCQFFSSRPSKTAESFHKLLCDGNIDETLKTLSSSNPMPQEMLRLGFATGIRECKEKGGFKSLEVADEKVDGETAFVKGKVKYGNDSEEPINMKMYKEGGAWKIVWQTPQERKNN